MQNKINKKKRYLILQDVWR